MHESLFRQSLLAQYVQCRLENRNVDNVSSLLLSIGYTQDELVLHFVKSITPTPSETVTVKKSPRIVLNTCNKPNV